MANLIITFFVKGTPNNETIDKIKARLSIAYEVPLDKVLLLLEAEWPSLMITNLDTGESYTSK